MTLRHRIENATQDIQNGVYNDESLKKLFMVPDGITTLDIGQKASRITFDTKGGQHVFRVLRGSPEVSVQGTVHTVCLRRNHKVMIDGHSFTQD